LESFIEEMKRYLGFTERDASLLGTLGPRIEKYLPAMAERFYSQISLHANAFSVITGGDAQIARLKQTLQAWGRGLFAGVYDEKYAADRYEIGYRHVRIGLEQKYIISAMGIVRTFLTESLQREFSSSDQRLEYSRALGRILDLDLNLMCESYFFASMENLRLVNRQLERANEELAQAGRVKDEFLSHVSHELRTPLNSILGFTKLILDGYSTDAEEQRTLLEDTFRSAQHLLSLVNDLLDVSRIEAGRVPLHMEEIELRQLLDSTLPLVAVQAASKGLRLADETLDGQLPAVYADEVRLRQVLLNLLSNAVKYTREGGITIRAKTDKVEKMLRVEVEDTGIGIPPDRREAVFEKFVRVQSDQMRGQEGTGLGLTISRRLVELMGGEIGIEEGTEGRGTRVWFTLRVAPATAERKTSQAASAPSGT
jgi:signal transduction histidine kinase